MEYRKQEKPDDMADETVISADGVNPVARDDERPTNGYENGIDIAFPGVVPPSYFPGFPGGASYYPGFPGGPSIG